MLELWTIGQRMAGEKLRSEFKQCHCGVGLCERPLLLTRGSEAGSEAGWLPWVFAPSHAMSCCCACGRRAVAITPQRRTTRSTWQELASTM